MFDLRPFWPAQAFDQDVVDRERLVGQEVVDDGLRQHLLEECGGHLACQHAVRFLRKMVTSHIWDIQIEADATAEQPPNERLTGLGSSGER